MASYNGFSRKEMILSKVTAIAALGVAMFPCECGSHDEVIPKVHAISAAVMFFILAVQCQIFYRRAKSKGLKNADRRANVYAVCGVVILLSIGVLLTDYFLSGGLIKQIPRLTFYCEKLGLMAFGIAWLAASHILPGITDPQERWSRT
jgi:hypothetical protein